MKKRLFVLLLTVVFLFATVITVCFHDTLQLRWAIRRYQAVLAEELPEDITLTIYYLPYTILTRAPLTIDDLIGMEDTVKIVVPSDELASHLTILKELDYSAVQPDKEEHGLNARFYYVLEARNSQKILEVAIQQFTGSSDDFGAFVNGIAVEKNPVIYEIILPFLSEEDLSNLGLDEIGEHNKPAERTDY